MASFKQRAWNEARLTFTGPFPLGLGCNVSHRFSRGASPSRRLLVISPARSKGHIASRWPFCGFLRLFEWLGSGTKKLDTGSQRGNSRPEKGAVGSALPFPKLYLTGGWWPRWGPTVNPRMSSQRGRTSPGVSIIAARRVTQSRPGGRLPARLGGDAPLPPWPLETSRERRAGGGGAGTGVTPFWWSLPAEYKRRRKVLNDLNAVQGRRQRRAAGLSWNLKLESFQEGRETIWLSIACKRQD